MIARLRTQDGFTLVEVLTAMVVGLVVLAAAFDLIVRSTTLATTAQDRVDASQRGRFGLENIVTELRSGVCVTPDVGEPQPPIINGQGNRVEFYAKTGADSATPQRRVLTYDPDRHTISEATVNLQWADSNSPGKVKTPIPAPTSTRVLLSNVYPRDTGQPIFRYYGYEVVRTGTAPDGTPIWEATGLADPALDPKTAERGKSKPPAVELPVPTDGIAAAPDVMRVIAVAVAFRVRPASVKSTNNDPRDAIVAGTAFARTANPAFAVDDQKVVSVPQPDGTQKNVGPGIQCS